MGANKTRGASYIEQLIEKGDSNVVLNWPESCIPKYTEKNDLPDYLPMILNARVYDVAKETPLTFARKLSKKLGSTVYIKREDQQPVFSFKCRGAFNRMFHLTSDQKKRGVCCVSAGNHAQGVALAAQNLGIKATIIMPTFAPEIKVENVRRLGADVVLFGNNFDEAKKECARICEERQLTFIPPYDDPLVIAGQGTVGMEILSQMKQTRLDAIFVCCGGGGLLAGIAAFVKRVRPEVKIIGVNTFDSDSMRQSLINGQPTDIKTAGLFSDGTSIRVVGTECVKICKHYVDDMVLVTNDEICAAIKDCFEETRSILEPAGALGIAGLKRYLNTNPGLKGGVYVCVASGANMNFDRLHFVTERASVGEGKEVLLSVKLPEMPGTLKTLIENLNPKNITELSYRYCNEKDAHVFCGFEVGYPGEGSIIVGKLNKIDGFTVLDITDNEMANQHVRFMSGGRSASLQNEILIRFRLPETPGSVLNLISSFEPNWNITLFHYRNHGADYGRVLIGLQIPNMTTEHKTDLIERLKQAGNKFVYDETDNPAYKHFMQ